MTITLFILISGKVPIFVTIILTYFKKLQIDQMPLKAGKHFKLCTFATYKSKKNDRR